MGVGMAPLEAGDELVEKLGQFYPAERTRPQLLEKRAIQELQAFGDRKNFFEAARDLRAAPVRLLFGEILD